MTGRILKIELVSLFLLSLISFIAFYYATEIPDNIYSISSATVGVSVISYYFFSFVSLIGFFVGPWILFPFVTFAVIYTFILTKRDSFLDATLFITLLFSFVGVINYFSPEFVGEGLQSIIGLYVGKVNLLLVSIVTSALSATIAFRGSFWEFIKQIGQLLMLIPRGLKVGVQKGIAFVSKIQLKKLHMLKFKKKPTTSEEEVEPVFVKIKEEHVAETQEMWNEVTGEQENIITPEVEPEVEQEVNKVAVTAAKSSPVKAKKTARRSVNYQSFVQNAFVTADKKKTTDRGDQAYFTNIIEVIEKKLQEFKIDGKIVNILKGPVVDTFELALGAGVKVSKVTNLSDDLSLALAGAPIRMEHSAMGRTTIGIEVPRDPRDFIYLDDITSSEEYKNNRKMHLPLAMGENVVGEFFMVDLASAPHMLVAGETGSGKSVFVHSLLVSLLMQKSPEEMRLIMIDPKQVEMMPYCKLPHLLMPVINSDKDASLSLLWACQEMDKRYAILKEFQVRNIGEFNEKLQTATPDMLANIHQYYEGTEEYKLPYIVVVVDEYADLILGPAGKDIEQSICRLGQKARAAGIHVILTTQRPSTTVVTGLIKANFPTRVALKVTSAIDSRVILDKNGAEKLLGYGDMLYKKGTELVRLHSPFVKVEEVVALVEQLSQLDSGFDPNAMDFLENGGNEATFQSEAVAGGNGNISNDLFNQAVEFVLTQKMASTSSLQRKFRIGYNKAADLADLLEQKGVVGPSKGAKGREVLGPPSA